MPPKRIVKNAGKPKAPPQLVSVNNEQTSEEATEAELKFDQEVLWCINQFEKLLSSGKLPEAKKQESIKAINTLRKPGVAKIQKIQLMKQYFKDYKAKMLKEETEIQKQSSAIFQNDDNSDKNKGTFFKKKSLAEKSENSEESSKINTSGFLFNFKDPSENQNISKISDKVNSIKLS